MRVAVVSESFLPTTNGVTNSVCKVLDHLRLRGHDAIVIVPAAGAPAEYAGFPVVQVPAVMYRQFPVGLPNAHMQRILADFAPDVVHAASPFLLGAGAIGSARRLGIPSIAIFQTDVAGYARRNRLGAATKFAWRVIRWIHNDASLTLVPSSSSMVDLRRAGLKRLRRWGRGVDLVQYHPRNRAMPEAVALRERLSPNGEVVVGYVGRFAPEKQIERLAALRDIPGISIALVGAGPSTPQVKRALADMPVTYLGELRGDALAAAYASFDLFVHTGTEETFGQTLQEAHASGLPVVAPRSGGPIDLIDHGRTGFLFDPVDDAELASTVELLARDPALRHRMGEAGRRGVLGRSWESVCDELLGHYHSVRITSARVVSARAVSARVRGRQPAGTKAS
ncbi:phosphatidylinositol alpha 1,6-mannosyltransferase [Glaciihabitans tibetensis]|uniref:D-inositol 3-phosphate glycosyltransferase n=1 Tax=Glaciihabitans tibetensis TaxID=1266600 RepID=A0A2T0VF72_9MICO|nr:glycosyltransferase family 1 protein [Glaciihabitans tibetensis]PRY68845.1 phosphatidylinositol alpha 1,6-mannosyltransferase [Glaciihabitans tibetensis]